MPTFVIVGAGIMVIAIVLLVIGLSRNPAGQDLVEDRIGGEDKSRKKKKKKKEGRGESVIGAAVDRAVEGQGFAQDLATQLARANLKWTVGEFLTMCVTIALGAAVIFYLLNRAFLIPVGLLGGFLLPRLYIGIQRRRRLKEFDSQLGDALNLMVNSLRAGYSTMQAMESISNEMPPPLAEEFGRVVLELQLGVDFDTAMANLLRRVPSADMDLIVTAMSVQREVGGNLAEVLDSISETIRERVRIKGEIRTMTSQGRITGILVTSLPFILTGIISLLNPDYIGMLIEDACGWIMIGVSFLMIGLGYFAMNKIVSIEV
ncbi:MAG: secretion system protein F [Chloroflexi bacterium]|jgi:tight adherence protein B|nr:secretion system protein F [Chloroflexota bacterium]